MSVPVEELQISSAAYQRDGVVHLAGVLDDREMMIVEAAFARKLDHPGPLAQRLYPEAEGVFLNARGRSPDDPTVHALLTGTRIPELVARAFGSGPVWFHGEQIFFKDARGKAKPVRRTPWHQDASYDPFLGSKIAIVWINLDPVPAESALEFIRGSNRGPLYNAPTFTGDDDTAPFFPASDRPRLPDIQADRGHWDILGWPAERGDVLIFHSQTLHGGGATLAGTRRRSLTLRFVGDDVVRVALPPRDPSARLVVDPLIRAAEGLAVGTPYHQLGLRKVHPGHA